MARYLGPKCKTCRAEKTKLFLKGERCHTSKCPIAKKAGPPGKGPKARTKKMTDYGIQLREKQKLRKIYCMLEKQFKLTFEHAEKMAGKTGENLIMLLERRLDNVVFRMRFASSRNQSRQLVSHGHVLVNGKRVNIPSYRVNEGDEISIAESSSKMIVIKECLKEYSKSGVMPWIELDPDSMKGKMLAVPRRSEITELAAINEQLIVELYSR
ncbi:MAG: 30S ribosomal protein S4 [Spirochaetia bacterium]|jgi:small subunit ribosomal protein S4|nr:30S ribosomal protein S4 [Spirochaetia bacterium]